jgi:hypothetical protein
MSDFPTALTSAVDNTTDVLAKHINNLEAKVGIDSSAVTTSLDYKLSLAKSSLFQQMLVNGNFNVWQRGTTTSFTTTDGYTADGWYVDTATAGDDKTILRIAVTTVLNSQYSARVRRSTGETGHTVIRLTQALESQDCVQLRGSKLTLSFYAMCGASYSSPSSVLTAKIVTGKGTDEKVIAFTTSADAVTSDVTLTTSMQKFTITTTEVIASDITQIGVSFSYDPSGTGATGDYFQITQVQLCVGEVSLPFAPKKYSEELTDCRRFCYGITTVSVTQAVAFGTANATTIAYTAIFLPVEMRVVPALATATAADWQLDDSITAPTDVTALVIDDLGFSNTKIAVLKASAASGLTANRPYYLCGDGTGGRILILSADF